MLIDFFVAPDAIADPAEGGLPARDTLLRALREFGRRAGDPKDWAALLNALPQDEKRLWTETLMALPSTRCGAISTSTGPHDLQLRGDADALAVLRQHTADDWISQAAPAGGGQPADILEQLGVEICPLGRITRSVLLSQRECWRDQRLPHGMSREEVWQTRLAALASSANALTIVDRYFLSTAAPGASSTDRGNDNGAFWLFNTLSSACSASPIKVVLFSAEPDPPFDVEVEATALALIEEARGAVFELEVHSAGQRLFGGIEHDRYWRAWTGSRSMTVRFGTSVDVFDNARLDKPVTFGFAVDVGPQRARQDQEERLERASRSFLVKRGDTGPIIV